LDEKGDVSLGLRKKKLGPFWAKLRKKKGACAPDEGGEGGKRFLKNSFPSCIGGKSACANKSCILSAVKGEEGAGGGHPSWKRRNTR